MNKRNKILIGCLALLLALSVGYALFSETITINGTATAKGSFSFTTTCTKGTYSPYSDMLSSAGIKEGGYDTETESCSVNKNEVTFLVNLKYPSATRLFTVDVENTGTIDALFDPEEGVIFSYTKNCVDSDGDGNAETCSTLDDSGKLIGTMTLVGVVDVSGNHYMPGTDEFAAFYDENDNIVISPGEKLIIIATVQWPSNVSGDEVNGHLWITEATGKINLSQAPSN